MIVNGNERIVREAISYLRQEKVIVLPVTDEKYEEKAS